MCVRVTEGENYLFMIMIHLYTWNQELTKIPRIFKFESFDVTNVSVKLLAATVASMALLFSTVFSTTTVYYCKKIITVLCCIAYKLDGIFFYNSYSYLH